jgi:imidazolonepropionase-like amidohydrolase
VCGLAAETGRLAEGHSADVLVVDGDLSFDITGLSRPREVLARGTRVSLG